MLDKNLKDILDIPDKKIEQLKKKGFQSLKDLLFFFPRRYEDRSNVIEIADAPTYDGQKVSVIGKVCNIKTDQVKKYCRVTIMDGKGHFLSIVWFHQTYIAKQFNRGESWLFYGKITHSDNYGTSINAPEFYSRDLTQTEKPMPVYSKVKGMSEEYLKDCIRKAFSKYVPKDTDDPMPNYLKKATGVDGLYDFLRKSHFPNDFNEIEDVKRRQNVEILFPYVYEMTKKKFSASHIPGKQFDKEMTESSLAEFTNKLPFTLTPDQERVLKDISVKLSSGRRLDALIQGDVSCGKTMIAIGATAMAAANGYQTVIMAPTEVLAEQHFHEFSHYFPNTVFLTGGMKVREKRQILSDIAIGKAQVIVGTHAVISQDVHYKKLGLTVVDEEHRFGVEQRKELQRKAEDGAHNISMSATPIPRSLALALYGDIVDIYDIHTMPGGRKPVQTILFKNERGTYKSLLNEIRKGHQGYIICPLIEANEVMEGVDSLEETYEKIKDFFQEYADIKIGCINGKMKKNVIQEEINKFASNEYQILMSTTIVEVGVNVPNATVMIIKNAERFGLAQLHQLRGRVGRGSEQSYCVLLSNDLENERLNIMTETNDGFKIAEEDLKQRGTGNLVGVEQSGFDKAVDCMTRERKLYDLLCKLCEKIINAKQIIDQIEKYAN